MLISLMARERTDFDGFLAFYNAHVNGRGLMCWQQVSTACQLNRHPAGKCSMRELPDTVHYIRATSEACIPGMRASICKQTQVNCRPGPSLQSFAVCKVLPL